MATPRAHCVVHAIVFGVRKLDRIDYNSTANCNALQTIWWCCDILWHSSISTPWTKFGQPMLRHTMKIKINKGKLSWELRTRFHSDQHIITTISTSCTWTCSAQMPTVVLYNLLKWIRDWYTENKYSYLVSWFYCDVMKNPTISTPRPIRSDPSLEVNRLTIY
jgi:hypothetical protein